MSRTGHFQISGGTHRHQRNRLGLNRIRGTKTTSHQTDDAPANATITAPLTVPSGAVLIAPILVNLDVVVIVIFSDAQQLGERAVSEDHALRPVPTVLVLPCETVAASGVRSTLRCSLHNNAARSVGRNCGRFSSRIRRCRRRGPTLLTCTSVTGFCTSWKLRPRKPDSALAAPLRSVRDVHRSVCEPRQLRQRRHTRLTRQARQRRTCSRNGRATTCRSVFVDDLRVNCRWCG